MMSNILRLRISEPREKKSESRCLSWMIIPGPVVWMKIKIGTSSVAAEVSNCFKRFSYFK